MTDHLEQRLTTEFREGAYDLPVDYADLSAAVRRRRARRSRAVVGGSAAAVVAVTLGGIVAVNGLSGPPANPVPAQTSATGGPRQLSADTVQLADVMVGGLPAGFRLAPEPDQALAEPPKLTALPTDGDRAVVVAESTAATTSRIVVVIGFAQKVGMPGAVTQEVKLPAMDGAKWLVTEDAASSTTYFRASTPTGRRWFIAVTGPKAADRLAVVESVAGKSVPGS